MKQFGYAAPRSLQAALELLSAHPKALLLAGGTDLIVQLRAGRKTTDLVIDVKKIPELNELHYDSKTGLTLGAAVPCYRIYDNEDVSRKYPSLASVAGLIGGTQIQGRASIGGNLCNAAPSADAVPLLIALKTSCRVVGHNGIRTIAVEDFCAAPGRNVLQPGELLVSLHVPPPDAHFGAHYLRFIPRNEMDIAVVGAGVAVKIRNGSFDSARVALSSVAPTPLYVREAGDWLAGKPATPESIEGASEFAKSAAKPISDMRGSIEFRKQLCAVLTRRALEAALREAREAN